MNKILLCLFAAALAFLAFKGFRIFFPADSDHIDTKVLFGKWRRIDIAKSPAACKDNHIEYLNDSEMVIVNGPLHVRSKYTLQDNVEGAYAIVKSEFRLAGDYDCTGTFIDSVKSRHFTIGRWIIWKKGNRLRQYIREDRSGQYIEFKRF